MTEKRCYRRENKIFIGSNGVYNDIILPIGSAEAHINGDIIVIRDDGKEEECVITKGDSYKFGNYEFSFYDEYIEIEGDFSLEVNDRKNKIIDIKLERIKNAEVPFEGYPVYKRSPRVIYNVPKEKIKVKAPSEKQKIDRGGLGEIIAPALATIVLSVTLAVVMRRGIYILMSVGTALVGIVFSIKNFFKQKKEKKDANKEREETYNNYVLNLRAKIRALRNREKEAMSYNHPKINDILYMIKDGSARLYERSLLDDDFLSLTLGYYSGKSSIDVEFDANELDVKKDELFNTAKEIPNDYKNIDDIPVVVDLKKAHLGLVGSKANIHEQLKIYLNELTFFQSYRDLEIIFIYNANYKDEFKYTKWYPHLNLHSLNCTGIITSESLRDQIVGSIQQILKDRKLKIDEENKQSIFSPYFLFIIDDPKLIINHAIMEYLQGSGETLGFSIIYTTDIKDNLPENIKSVCVIDNSNDATFLLNEGVRVNRHFELQRLHSDLEIYSRSLAKIEHQTGMKSRIPDSVTFLEMYNVAKVDELNARERWNKNSMHKTLSVPLGLRAKDDIVYLDLHERAHGPHGLIAGTTGSGKSEIVQSYILSLAINFHPNEVGFLLIDYKGGGMAGMFEKLPHLLGTITNLDKAESMRAMESINRELVRRQEVFSAYGVNHINDYNKLFRMGKATEPMPTLFLISDEFAELKSEQPEFMNALISTARIGRSLGVKLILATQKPSGVVDDQIWSNTKFRLCLKVADTMDSKEMLKTPDAASIVEPGRAYLQVGNNEIYELFQSAYSGADYKEGESAEEKEDDRVYLIGELGQGELLNKDLSGGEEVKEKEKYTELNAIVDYLHNEYEKDRKETESRGECFVTPPKPWIPSLDVNIVSPYTKEIKDTALLKNEEAISSVPIGIIDIPEKQAQEEYILDLEKNGDMLYMASSGYGKTVFLTNAILSLSLKNSVESIKFYLLDFGNSGLIPIKDLPHIADYITTDDVEKQTKLLKILEAEIKRRKNLFAKESVPNISVYNDKSYKSNKEIEKIPFIVLAIDNFDAIGECSDEFLRFITKIARDGAGLGIYLLVTMNRTNAMRGSMINNFKEKIAGFNFEPSENSSIVGRSDKQLPEDKIGRALIKRDNVNVMQLYTPVSAATDSEYIENLGKLISVIKETITEEKAKGIPVLPEELSVENIDQYGDIKTDINLIPIGLDAESIEIRYLDLNKNIGLIVGETGSGRTNFIKNCIDKALSDEMKIYIFDGNESSLKYYKDSAPYANNKETSKELIKDIADEIKKRKESYDSLDNKTEMEYYRETSPTCIFIDTIQKLYENLSEDNDTLDVLDEAYNYGFYVIATSDEKLRDKRSKFLGRLLDLKTGIIVGNEKEQSVFYINRSKDGNQKIDMGYIFERGNLVKIKLIENRRV